MKRVFDNYMVVHVWAQQGQPYGRNARESIHFDGPTLYSYREPIARFVTGADGSKGVVYTAQRWSVTTSAHQSAARSSARHWPHFTIPHVTGTPENNRAAMVRQRGLDLESITDAKNKVSRAKRYESAESYINSCNHYLRFVGLPELDPIPADLDAVKAEVTARREAEAAERERKEAAYREQTRKYLEEAQEKVSEWLTNSERTPDTRYAHYLDSQHMKIIDDEVITTMGATVPIEHVRKAAPVVLAMIREGRTYKTNGHSIRLGHFAIDEIDENGTVHAGCHVFNRAEIERFAAVLEAAPAPETATA